MIINFLVNIVMVFKAILDVIVTILLVHFYILEAIVRFFIPPSRKDVKGEVVLVTGAGSGLGKRMSIEFAKLGCVVVGWDISESGLQDTRQQFAEIGLASQWHSYICDLGDRHQIYDTAKKVKSEVGHVKILINNAGIVTGKTLLECRDELMTKTMEINTMAHFWTTKAFLPKMMENNHGHIVTIASGAGMFGVPGQVDYAASKFGAVGLTEALAMELAVHGLTGVKTTLVCPYYINTGMFEGVSTPFIKIIEAKDAVDQIVDAVLRNKVLLMMPRILYILYAFKGLLPAKAAYLSGKRLGVLDSMDTFVGRNKRK